MSSALKLNLVVLIDDELRAAANALRTLRDVDPKDQEASDTAFDRALQLCWRALYHLTIPGAEESPIVCVYVPLPRVTLVPKAAEKAEEPKP